MAGRAETAARKRAREARIRRDANRAARDRSVEEAAAKFFVQNDELAKVEARAHELRTTMAEAIGDLSDLGESQKAIAELLDIETTAVRGLLSLRDDLPGGDEDRSEPGAATAEEESDAGEPERG